MPRNAEQSFDGNDFLVRRFGPNDTGSRAISNESRCQSRGRHEFGRALIAKNRVEAIVALLGKFAAGGEQAAIVAEEPALWSLEDFAAQRALTLNLQAGDAVNGVAKRRVRVQIGMDE